MIINVYYQDDIERVYSGLPTYWLSDGRPFSTFLMMFLQGHFLIPDMAPFNIILSAFLLSMTGLLLAKRLLPDGDMLSRVLIGLSLIVSPFYLGNLSFRYDVLPMSIAQCLAIYAAIGFTKTSWKSLSVQIISLACVLNFYQPCINTFLLVSLFVFAEDKDLTFTDKMKKMGLNVLLAGGACVAYKVLLPIPLNTYATMYSKTTSFDSHSFKHILSNMKDIGVYIKNCLSDGTFFIMICLMCFAIISHLCSFKNRKDILYMLYPLFIPLFIMGYMLILNDTLLKPRIFVSFSIVMTFIVYKTITSDLFTLKARLGSIVAMYLSLFVFMCVYANTLNAHTQYEDSLAQLIMEKVKNDGFTEDQKLTVINHASELSSVSLSMKSHPIFDELITPVLDDKDCFVPLKLRKDEPFTLEKMEDILYMFISVKDVSECQADVHNEQKIYGDNRVRIMKRNNQYCAFLNDKSSIIGKNNTSWFEDSVK